MRITVVLFAAISSSLLVLLDASRSSYRQREYTYVRGKDGSPRSGKTPKNILEDLPDSFFSDPGQDFLYRRSNLPSTCGPTDLNGLDLVSDANTIATALVGNQGLSVVPGSAKITAWPGYGIISSWKAGHAIGPLFPNGDTIYSAILFSQGSF